VNFKSKLETPSRKLERDEAVVGSEILLPLIFILSMSLGLILYMVGGKIGAKGRRSLGKEASYACGEDFPPERIQVNMEKFLIYTVWFLIFDILAFMIATSMSTSGFTPLLYILIALIALLTLFPLQRR